MNIDLPKDQEKSKRFKLRHKPSGLFYRPSNGYEDKVNLSKRGKTYKRSPHVGSYFKDVDGKKKFWNPLDWEAVTMD